MEEVERELLLLLKNNIRNGVGSLDRLGKMEDKYLQKIIEDSNILQIYNINNNFNEMKKQCWIWNGSLYGSPGKGHEHGGISYRAKKCMVHRLMFHNFVADVPKYERKPNAIQVNHRCTHENNGRCINPYHMYLGTPTQNTRDSKNDGTKSECKKGQDNHNAKLSDKIIKEIMDLKGKTTLSQKEIAKKYEINQSQVSRYWGNVTRSQHIKEE